MPAGDEVTVPAPVPALVTLSVEVVGVGGAAANVAVTAWGLVNVIVHTPVPVQAPPHPVKVEPVSGVAVRVTEVPLLNEALQVVLHVIPLGEELTVPDPVPLLVRVRVEAVDVLMAAKVAVRLLAASTTRAQLPVPVQAPLQPVKAEPEAGVALRAMLIPDAKEALHVLPQSTPFGLEATVPLPVPALVTAAV
jgi:hypothetical protein